MDCAFVTSEDTGQTNANAQSRLVSMVVPGYTIGTFRLDYEYEIEYEYEF